MPTTADFLIATKWSGILTLVCAALTVLMFVFQWGVRFRFVGVTGFMGVLTVGFFALGLVPLTHTIIPGAAPFSLIYDSGASQAVISVSPKIKQSELDATLRQAASDLFSFGRLGGADEKLTIRARTIIHPEVGQSVPLYLGEVKRSLASRDDTNLAVTIYDQNFARLPQLETASRPS
ncbi:Ycf51 family protein [Trichocoleus sp. FACHB-591]|uniref:Ycf51 family protein n=1 Tax=Trichocoleus sp. FACHB-591 TaxID=2692872 RepID=UPI00168627F0|nr:Ycf51 family protein [Trichocoleus sp. FACHB-591]MBD2099214.1 Ycf51 family protein [Trichocoleus sp. FACHB-591]